MKRILEAVSICVVLLLLLAGCGHTPVPPAVPGTLEGVKKEVIIDARLLEPCADLSDIKTNPSPSDVLKQHGEDVKVNKDCKTRQWELVNVVKQAFNLK